ncbi:exopolysaccharide biosynthesis protein [Rhizobium sp. Leaf311]|uniref:O-antigen ligase family protein n=1 Tax=Rhizobium sp. Leaf311 TaxID=1736332 RepID=UPI000713029F|nr:O-antigen ligase [Rhizobium sp. Leaf311]KQQ54232.1 exopolysaccharide biosynthesis protein [Rhizobium sp. Leaf311]
MKILKSTLIDPDHNKIYGIFATASSFLVFAYSQQIGAIAVVFYYGLWISLVFVDYRRVLGNYSRYFWIFAFAVCCFLSAFWSQAPSVSFRAAIQYLSHIACALIAMRVLSTATLTQGGALGCAAVLVYSLIFGRYESDALDGSYTFVGAFASKNQLGLFASLGCLLSCGTLILTARKGWVFIALITGALSFYNLLASQSATSIITTMAVLALAVAMQSTLVLAPKHRVILCLMVFLGALLCGIFVLQIGGTGSLLEAFGKDSTLTGRTYLWQQGIAALSESPLFGVGYQGYWVTGLADAERLWDEFYIPSRNGFHFHNTYIETAVETGIFGTVCLILVVLTTLWGHLARFLTRRRHVESLLLFAVAALLTCRSFVEIDVLFAYQIGSFLLYFVAGKLTVHLTAIVRPATRTIRTVRYACTRATWAEGSGAKILSSLSHIAD